MPVLKKLPKPFFFLTAFLAIVGLLAWQTEPAASMPNQAGDWIQRVGGSFGQQQSISMANESDGWFLNFSYTVNTNTAYLARYQGLNWSPTGSVTHSQQIVKGDIEMISANDGWLVLGGWLGSIPAESSVYRWNGSSWNFVTMITDLNGIQLSSLDALGPNDVWALGAGNFWSTLYHWNGSAWSYAGTSPGGVWPDADLDMLTGNDGWAVGLNGAIARWNGSILAQVPSPVTTNLNAVSMVDSSTGWAVGDNGTILNWNGTSWTSYASPTTAKLTNIQMVSADEGWIIGAGTILHWDGSQWSTYTPPQLDQFNGIDMVSSTDGWIVGNSYVLQYEVPEPELIMNYSSGAPGSYFNVIGQNFPANSTAALSVNGRSLGTVLVNASGNFYFSLTTTNADEGTYFLTATVNPTATRQFTLSTTEPVHPQDDPAELFDVPAGIAFTKFLFLPTISQ